MRTKLDPDDEFFIPELPIDWSTARPSRFRRKPGDKVEFNIDDAVGYQLRHIPSNKVLARFDSTLEAWPVILDAIDAGRSPRTLSLDWVKADGRFGSIIAGPHIGEKAWRYDGRDGETMAGDAHSPPPRRVAETA
jgi:hypothetical protein